MAVAEEGLISFIVVLRRIPRSVVDGQLFRVEAFCKACERKWTGSRRSVGLETASGKLKLTVEMSQGSVHVPLCLPPIGP
jgi:hypothetical protein